MVRKILVSFAVLALIVLIIPTFLSSKFSMSRMIVVDAPVSTVFAKLSDLHVYVKWNPFAEGDPTNKTNVVGSGAGSFMAWTGEKTGDGKMTLAEIEPEKKITIKMDFIKPVSGEGVVYWLTNPRSPTKTEMVWVFEQNLSYFMRYFGLVMDSMMGPVFEKGLNNFKTLVEGTK